MPRPVSAPIQAHEKRRTDTASFEDNDDGDDELLGSERTPLPTGVAAG